MRKNQIALVIAAFVVANAGPALARGGSHSGGGISSGSHFRSSYVTKNGTYVAPSYATNPNSTKMDNYSTRGNVNPYTGAPGTKPADH